MNIEIITAWYNEEFLAPYFLKHYAFADKIHILLDSDTDDNTLGEIEKASNAEIEYVNYPDGFDNEIKIGHIMRVYRTIERGWVFGVDSDEFFFPLPLETDIREALEREKDYDVIYAQMWQVYRHRSDADLNPDLPPVLQRRHGDPNVTEGENARYNKPAIVKAGLDFEWRTGCHRIRYPRPRNEFFRLLGRLAGKPRRPRNLFSRLMGRLAGKPRISPTQFYGAHWAKADPLCTNRRVGRKDRLSRNNVEKGYSRHYLQETEKGLCQELEAHLDDPLLF